MQVRSLGWEDPLEEGTATHSSILTLKNRDRQQSGSICDINSGTREAR